MNFLAKLVCSTVLGVTIASNAADELRIGMIGLDTSHVTAFAALLNDPKTANHIAGARIVAVGTESFRDPAAGSRIAAELNAELARTSA